MSDFNLDEFLHDRKQALLSMDRATIEAYMQKYGIKVPSNEEVFWISVHKARTGDKFLPMFERAASKRWLEVRGYQSMDNGDVLPPLETYAKYYERCKDFGIEDAEIRKRNKKR
jgi:hypothetical protein